ncbi:hypothetical protein COCSUDRAFT_33681 [Coccomyxa subellipsoidea C-169]|uniref:Uncharacterized protein n=1 Tax=Coccomyxa subellipsoidea (strain C-169) TaxID=574566 RepID=I0YSW7_COCSC|nr:hypothetical protein COCSUDRAFT_33681 [Coccomyxa subellipsoidea C-169]EIE21486.1 hypothetical protein COCSUDRAFT_33681 [Coccomyxa subellipsoidea C-169]|eukprot:XP_005646030.1 hypothetical protein COCSUDRAFT_33681 [Coccomyxa subellipsoidea C-169]
MHTRRPITPSLLAISFTPTVCCFPRLNPKKRGCLMAYSAICSRATKKSKLDTKGAACQLCPQHLDLDIVGYSALATPARSRYARKTEARDGQI